MKPILTFGYYTGCRRGEILGLEWPQVDLDADVIRLRPIDTKNRIARLLPLTGDLLETIQEQKQRAYPGCPYTSDVPCSLLRP